MFSVIQCLLIQSVINLILIIINLDLNFRFKKFEKESSEKNGN